MCGVGSPVSVAHPRNSTVISQPRAGDERGEPNNHAEPHPAEGRAAEWPLELL